MSRVISRKKIVSLFFLGLSLLFFAILIYFFKMPKKISVEEVSHNLFSSSLTDQKSAFNALADLNPNQLASIKADVFKYVENKIDNVSEKDPFAVFQVNNTLVAKIARYYPQDKITNYLIRKNQLNQTHYLADQLLAFDRLVTHWATMLPEQLNDAILLRDRLTVLLPNAAFSEDHRLDFALLLQSEKALLESQQQQGERFIQKISKNFSQTDYRNDLLDRMANGSQWSNKHYPVILSDEWLVELEHILPNQAIWLQKQPEVRAIQEKIATHYLRNAEKWDAQHRYFLALSTLEKARYFASNVPSVELSYELEKKRYDLFLVERKLVEEKIKRAGQEKIFETLLAIGAISQAENLLAQKNEFQEAFIQTKVPIMIKAAYDNLAAFTKLQNEIEGNKAIYYASYDLSSLHRVQQNDLLNDDDELPLIEDDSIQKLSAAVIKNRLTYLKIKPTNSSIKLPPALKSELTSLTNVEPFLYGFDGITRFIVLPKFIAEKKELSKAPPVAQKPASNAKKPMVIVDNKKKEAKKTPLDRLGAQLVETTAKYTGKDECAKAWYRSSKKTSVACHDKISGSERPISLVVIPLNNDSKRLYAISERPVSFGDFNRYCLLSRECKPISTKPDLKTKKPKKDDDLPEAGLDLSDVQESIEEYDDFCVITGTCSGTFEEQNGRPINTLSQAQIANYLRWLSKTTGQIYRLPTIEERLYALKVNPNAQLALDNKGQSSGFHVVREINKIQ